MAQFAANGKMSRKKDLGLMAMSYGNVYVAQIAMGASGTDPQGHLRSGSLSRPSLIIAYSPCLNHGIKGGLGNSQMQAKRAVEAGYWSLYHYDPRRIGQGENPFVLDSRSLPTASGNSCCRSALFLPQAPVPRTCGDAVRKGRSRC
ncbi:MAG: hypothetical protein ACLT2T_06150 [Bilophila wadsworthia]